MNATGKTWSLLLTPAGTGAIGVVRVIGPHAPSVIEGVFRATGNTGLRDGHADRLRYGWFLGGEERIDKVVVSRYSIDGRPALDIAAHGGVRVIERILETLDRHGAPLGRPNMLPGHLWPAANLIDEEAVVALGQAQTERAVRFLAWQRRHLASELRSVAATCRDDPEQARGVLRAMMRRYPAARMLVDGAAVALVGPANSGKSTLFNRLVGRSAAVVSPRPGTTRDWVSAPVDIQGIPVILLDTAGGRSTDSALERLAINMGRQAGIRADLRILVLDGARPLAPNQLEGPETQASTKRGLVVLNKLDRGSALTDSPALGGTLADDFIIGVSARTGRGIDRLVERIAAVLGLGGWPDDSAALFTERQIALAERVLSVLADDSPAAVNLIQRRLLGLRSRPGSDDSASPPPPF